MPDQLFTDDVMCLAAVLTWLVMFGILLLLWRWRDMDALWALAFLVPQSAMAIGYYLLWLSPDSPIGAFPVVSAFNRPGTVGVWSIVLLYSFYRLWEKRSWRL